MENRLSQGLAPEWQITTVANGGQCPKPDEWLPLLGGEARLADDANLDALLVHAAECGKCASHLRMLTAEPSAEEAAELARLVSASSDWQMKLAAELACTPLERRRPVAINRLKASKIYLWTGSAVAATLMMGAVTFFWWQHANSPERLLAEAYSQSRTYDLRMPGADFAEVAREPRLRGGATAHDSSRLPAARALIERQLQNAPENPHWLELEARADIQEEKFDPAIEILDRLLATEPATAGLLVDDASAYFERGSSTGSESDRATALEDLRRADELAPDNPLVLFNEAVVMEDRGQAMNAVETWNRYLKFERDPRWLAEGHARLQTLEQKLNQLKTHQGRVDQHPGTPQVLHAPTA